MPDVSLPPDYAITRESYLRHNLTRPLTDDPIGGSSGRIIRRQQGANASRIVTQIHADPDPFDRQLRDPDTAMADANAILAAREARRRARDKARKAATAPPSALQAAIDAATALAHPQTPQDAA